MVWQVEAMLGYPAIPLVLCWLHVFILVCSLWGLGDFDKVLAILLHACCVWRCGSRLAIVKQALRYYLFHLARTYCVLVYWSLCCT